MLSNMYAVVTYVPKERHHLVRKDLMTLRGSDDPMEIIATDILGPLPEIDKGVFLFTGYQ